jgi:hypothetical protein
LSGRRLLAQGPADDPIAAVLNRVPKHVASHTLDTVEWNNSRLLKLTARTWLTRPR